MSCPGCPDVELGEWSEELLRQLGGARYPFHGTFELTERCNLSCVHCYINQPAGSERARAGELSAAQIAAIIDQAADAGCLYLLLTGGEALLRPDLPEIYVHAKKRGLLVTLFTNGTLLTAEIADLLAEWPPWGIEISLYGRTQRTYEQVTRVPGSHARCMRGIDLAMDRGLRLSLKASLLSLNRHELPAMQALARELGLTFRYDPLLWPRLDGGRQPFDYGLSAEEIAALDREDPERMQEWIDTYRHSDGSRVRTEYIYSCGAGFHGFHVDCSGRLSLCMMSRSPAYDLLRGSFGTGWGTFLASLLEQKRVLDTPCPSCTAGALCTKQVRCSK